MSQEGGVDTGSWYDRDLGRRVVVHSIDAPATTPDRVEEFVRTMRLGARLEHPGIPPIHDLGRGADGSVFATSLAPSGRSLAQLAGVLERSRSLRVIRQVAEILDYAHDLGVLHGFLGPDDVLVDEVGGVHVVGWGRSPPRPGEDPAPAPIEDRSPDIRALAGLLRALVEPPGRRTGLPRPLEAILRRASQARERTLYRRAGELAEDLARFQSGEAVRARADPPLARAWRAARRHPKLSATVLGAAAAAALGATAIAFESWRSSAERDIRRREALARELHEGRQAAEGSAWKDLSRAIVLLESGLARSDSVEESQAIRQELARARLRRARLAFVRAKERGGAPGPVHEALPDIEAAIELDPEVAAEEGAADLRRSARGRTALSARTEPRGHAIGIFPLARDSITPGPLVARTDGSREIELDVGGYLLRVECPEEPFLLPILLESEPRREIVVSCPPAERGPPGFVYVPAGRFRSGPGAVPATVDEGFYISLRELDWGSYQAFLDSIGAERAAHHEPRCYGATGLEVPVRSMIPVHRDAPVCGVGREDLVAYAIWASERDPRWTYRLPTRLEWEWAARGADGRTYPWGEEWAPELANLRGDPTRLAIEAMDGRPAGRSVFGCFHMAGNLAEWVSDVEEWISGDRRTGYGRTCGGAWDGSAPAARCWTSSAVLPSHRLLTVGGRMVAVPDR